MKKAIIVLLIFLALDQCLIAQLSPAGVTNTTLWIRSDTNTVATAGALNSWTYINNVNSFLATGAARPTLTANVLNFKPSVNFNGAQIMFGPNGVNAPLTAGDDDYTILAVWRSASVTQLQRVWTQLNTGTGGSDGAALATWTDGRYGDEVEVSPFNHTLVRPYDANVWNITELKILNQPLNDLEIYDDRNLITSPTVANTDPSNVDGAALRNLGDALNSLGGKFTAGEQALNGDIIEVAIITRTITATERANIFSYFALKYGLTINTNFTSSTGTVIWNATANAAYNIDVFGLGSDAGSSYNSRQSNSINTGSGNGAGQSGKGNIVLSIPTAAPSQNFLIIGHNNGALTESTSNLPTGTTGSKRLDRQWKVQHTGNVGILSESVDLNGLTVSGVAASNFRLAVDADGDGNFTTGTVRYYTPDSYTGGVLNFSNVTLNNNEIFTIITLAAGPTLPVTWKSFTGQEANGNAILNWEVSDNAAAKEYQVEQSADGITFIKVGTVANITGTTSYTYKTKLNNGINYFRLNQVDLDGKSYFSKTISIRGNELVIKMLSNPIKNNIVQLEINAQRGSKAIIEVRSMNGSSVARQNNILQSGLNRISVPLQNASAGNYTVTVEYNGIIYNTKITKL